MSIFTAGPALLSSSHQTPYLM